MKPITFLGSAALLFGTAQAHITMQSPAPFNPLYDTSPLAASGSDFPCKKGAADFSSKGVANATISQPIQLSFKGSADHSGGSCQVVLSKDGVSAWSPNSQFKVIYSIMGGCPGISGTENTYSVPIPSEVPSGTYTMGWTWFNNLGNREMYMNCATMDISGGKATDAEFSSLPDMAIYNLGFKNDCKTSDGKDVQFPNPGKYVLTAPGFKPAPPSGSCATGDSGTPNAPVTSTGGGSAAPSGGSPVSSNPGAGGSSASGSFDDGQYHPKNGPSASIKAGPDAGPAAPTTFSTASAPTLMATADSPKPAVATAPASPPQKPDNSIGGFIGMNPPPSATAGPSGASPIPAPAAGQSCSTDGAVMCSPDGTQFGLCNFGKIQFMAVAEGTKCVDGKIAGRRVRKIRSSI